MAVLGQTLQNSYLANAKFSARLACLCSQLESGNVKPYRSMQKLSCSSSEYEKWRSTRGPDIL